MLRGVDLKVFTCESEWDAMLSCIYDAYSSGLGHKNIRLMTEPVGQMNLFDDYIHITSDSDKAMKMMDAINIKISQEFYREMAFTAMAFEEDALDNIYHMLILGFAYGPKILDMLQYKDVVRNREIRTRVMREAERFRESIRFHQVGNVYVAHIEPKSRVTAYLGPAFQDRMQSENFMIIDDVHLEAVIHKADRNYYIRKLNEDELCKVKKTEEINDGFTDLWKIFFNAIAIKERENYKCQLNHSPKWARKHIVEFL